MLSKSQEIFNDHRTNALLEAFRPRTKKINKQLNTNKVRQETMLIEIKDVFKSLCSEYFFTCSLLRRQPCKLQGFMIFQLCTVFSKVHSGKSKIASGVRISPDICNIFLISSVFFFRRDQLGPRKSSDQRKIYFFLVCCKKQ